MISKKDQKYILDVVGDEKTANHIINYLLRYKDCVSYEVFPNKEGESTKSVFHPLLNECWSTERFLKLLPFFYTKLSPDDIPDYGDRNLEVFEYYNGELSFEGILNELFENCKHMITDKEDETNEIMDYVKFDAMRTQTLEFYEKISALTGKTCREILLYLFNQPNPWYGISDLLEDWKSYVALCEQEGITDYCPEKLIISLNILKERAGEEIDLIYSGNWHEPERIANTYVFRFGYIPEIDGEPVKRWLGIRTSGDEEFKVEFDSEYEKNCYPRKNYKLIVELKPDSVLEELGGDEWCLVYSGPLNIDVDLSILKKRRKELKLTQKQVADAINVELRSYQKWENGDVPGIKGFYLIRLMRYLNFSLDDIAKEIKQFMPEKESGY